ncbi:MAG: PilZ domain-containing protein [Gammaproteobacteria bacterium]|nr:PilZ domain-containing protein [Gammaproteobacteria bacterium]
MSDERRTDQRLGIRLEVEVETETDRASLHTRDISSTGVFLVGDPPRLPTVGSILIIRVKQSLGDGEAPVVRAEVVRVDNEGIALKFLDL